MFKKILHWIQNVVNFNPPFDPARRNLAPLLLKAAYRHLRTGYEQVK